MYRLRALRSSAVIALLAMSLFMGIFPNVFLRPMEPSVNRVIERVHSRQGAQVKAVPERPAPPDTVPPAATSDND